MAEEDSSRVRRRWLVDVARWHPSSAQFQAAAALLPPHERPAIARFVKDDDRKRALVSRLLQYSLVHHVLAIPFHQINICRTAEGKPYLVLIFYLFSSVLSLVQSSITFNYARQSNHSMIHLHPVVILQQNKNVTFPNFNFNTSHQGDYVGIASEPLCLVGLDIVSISKPPGETTMEFIKNFSSYLTVHEWNCIVRAGTPDEMMTEFYRYWCLKEAFVKAVGAGVRFGLHRLEFHHVHWTSISIYIDGEESRNWRFWLFKLDEMHLASIAKGHPEDAVSSYKRTFSNVVVEEEKLHAALEMPEEAFTLLTVEQLTQLHD